ncbi:MAG TPA: DUF1772 domain-containing protein [Methylovirgula sp.]|nr:DUF1772 domain-containing protein [Methylovirgula sp.]
MLRPGLFAFAAASAFLGAALYIDIVEQPARLRLDSPSSIREWTPSYRRGFIMLAVLSVVSAILAYVDFSRSGNVLWTIGGVLIVASWLYAYFVMAPVNIWLSSLPPNAPAATVRELMVDWGLLEWGQSAIGFGAWLLYLAALATPY